MSVDIQWETLVEGPDGLALSETIRAFLDDKIQQIKFPKNLIRDCKVRSFDFGSIPPEIELKDICDPLPDFYEDDEDDEDDHSGNDEGQDAASQFNAQNSGPAGSIRHHHQGHSEALPCESDASAQKRSPQIDTRFTGFRGSLNFGDHLNSTSPLVSGSQTPGIPGGTSNLNYFHLPFGPGLSGTTTPLAAVAGAHFHGGWPDNRSTPLAPLNNATHQPSISSSSLTPPSTADPGSRPPSQHQQNPVESNGVDLDDDRHVPSLRGSLGGEADAHIMHDQSPNDIQIVTHVKYAGNMRLSLTAEILLDYPMPSFVGIPLQLNITGLRFDGVAILAYIKKRAHVCFLSPEHAEAFAGGDAEPADQSDASRRGKMGGLLEEIKVESEIGQKEPGKQVLKNVGKVEKFILEQVQRIFEDEFVYPSYWTFLV
jgi:distribution and morphology protein 12